MQTRRGWLRGDGPGRTFATGHLPRIIVPEIETICITIANSPVLELNDDANHTDRYVQDYFTAALSLQSRFAKTIRILRYWIDEFGTTGRRTALRMGSWSEIRHA